MRPIKTEIKNKLLSGLNKKERPTNKATMRASGITMNENAGKLSYVFSLFYGFGASPLNRA